MGGSPNVPDVGGPWGILSGAIARRAEEHHQQAMSDKESKRKNAVGAWQSVIDAEMAKLKVPGGQPDMQKVNNAYEEIGKLYNSKESKSVIEMAGNAIGKVLQHHRVKQAAGGGTTPAGPMATPPIVGGAANRPQPAGTNGGGPMGNPIAPNKGAGAIPPGMNLPQLTQTDPAASGKAEGQEAVAKETELAKQKQQQAEALFKSLEAHNIQVPDDVKASIIAEGASSKGFDLPTSFTSPKAAKEPELQFGPGGQFRAIKDPADGKTYASKSEIPKSRPDLLKMWDDAKQEEADAEKKQEAKENRQFGRQLAIQQQAMENALKRSDYEGAQKEVRKAKSTFQSSVSIMQRMDQSLKDIQKAKAEGHENQQAMVALLTNHIGMTSGMVPRGRVSKSTYDEAVKSAPWLERAEAHFDKDGYLTGIVLTDDQVNKMVELAHESVEISQNAVQRVEKDYEDALGARVPESMKGPGKGKSKGAGKGKGEKIIVTAEDMK